MKIKAEYVFEMKYADKSLQSLIPELFKQNSAEGRIFRKNISEGDVFEQKSRSDFLEKNSLREFFKQNSQFSDLDNELESHPFDRVSVELFIKDSNLVLEITSKDLTSMRSALNTWLRLIQITQELADVKESR